MFLTTTPSACMIDVTEASIVPLARIRARANILANSQRVMLAIPKPHWHGHGEFSARARGDSFCGSLTVHSGHAYQKVLKQPFPGSRRYQGRLDVPDHFNPASQGSEEFLAGFSNERQQFGKDGLEDAVRKIAEVETDVGLANLAQFTAPAPPRVS